MDPVVQLVAARKEQGLTQRVVAQRMGVSPHAVSRLERGLTDPYLSTLQRYALAVGATMRAYVEVLTEPGVGLSVEASDGRVWTRVEDDSVGSVWEGPEGRRCVWGWLWDHYRPLVLP